MDPTDLDGPSDLDRPSFLAVDLETIGGFGNPRPFAVGLVRVVDGEIVGEEERAVPCDAPSRVLAAFTVEVLCLLARAAAERRWWSFVAHNAAFDRGVLARACADFSARGDDPAVLGALRALPWTCTLALARARAPALADHRLPTVAGHYGAAGALRGPTGASLHHQPGADALAAAAIALGAWRGGADLRRRDCRLPPVGMGR